MSNTELSPNGVKTEIIENMKTTTTARAVAAIAGLLLLTICTGCSHIAGPVDGPGMERDSADYAATDSAATLVADSLGAVEAEADKLYKPRIENGDVLIDFDDELCKEFTENKLNVPYNELGKNRKVEGLQGKCVEILKCATLLPAAANPEPCIAMRTDKGEVFVLSITEALEEGDMTCGKYMNLADTGITKAKVAHLTLVHDEAGEKPAAVLSNGELQEFSLCNAWGYYVMDDYDLVIHLSKDWCLSIDKKEGPGACHIGGWFGSEREGHGQISYHTNLGLGIVMNIDSDSDENLAVKAMTLNYANAKQLSLPMPSGREISSPERLYSDPWTSGYFHFKNHK